jgi:serine/threonine-protein kinase
MTGAKFLDDVPGGRLRPSQGIEQNALTAQSTDTFDSSDTGSLPLVLPLEREHTTQQKSRRRAWIATLVVLTLLVLSGGGLWLYNIMNQAPPPVVKVNVPSVASLTESEALQKLYDAGLKPRISRVQHDTVAKGTAISTTPASGTSLEPNAEIILNVSDGPSAVAIPADLPGRTEAAARDVLRQKGLVGAPATIMNNSSTVPAGIVITTKPAPGQAVAVGSTVELVVSNGKVAVPQLIGLPLAEADAAVKALGLTLSVTEVENSQVQPGKVTSQGDAAEALVEQGKVIAVTVAKAPPPPPPPSPTPTPTPTSTKGSK